MHPLMMLSFLMMFSLDQCAMAFDLKLVEPLFNLGIGLEIYIYIGIPRLNRNTTTPLLNNYPKHHSTATPVAYLLRVSYKQQATRER